MQQPTRRKARRKALQRAKKRLPNRSKKGGAEVRQDRQEDLKPVISFLARPFHPVRDSERVGRYHVELMNVQKKLWSELTQGSAQDARQGNNSRSSPAQEGQMWARQLAQMTGRGEAHVLMIDTPDQQTVGYAFVAESPDPLTNERMGVVGELFVEEPWRKKGVGSHALRAAERWLFSRGIRAVQIFVTRTNVPAVDLYHKNGYTTYDYRMVKQLNAQEADAQHPR